MAVFSLMMRLERMAHSIIPYVVQNKNSGKKKSLNKVNLGLIVSKAEHSCILLCSAWQSDDRWITFPSLKDLKLTSGEYMAV